MEQKFIPFALPDIGEEEIEEVIKSLGKEISDEFIGRTYTPACGEEITINIRNPI